MHANETEKIKILFLKEKKEIYKNNMIGYLRNFIHE